TDRNIPARADIPVGGPRASSRESLAPGHGPAKKPGPCRGDHAALFFRIADKSTMCGIAGFTGPHNRTALELMTERLRHRGPDAVGYWEGAGVSLGMRRLSIIDVATAQQPVFNEDGTIAVVFNGEIYNYIELRDALHRAGHRFSTDHS